MATTKTTSAAPRNIFSAINLWMPTLSNTEMRIAQYFYHHYDDVAVMPMLKVAQKCNCSEGSIDRFCKKLGCSGFAQAKEMLATHSFPAENAVNTVQIEKQTSIEDLTQNISELYIHTLQRTMELNSSENFQTAINHIAKAKRLFLFGIGDALIPCLCAYYRFRRIGIICIFDADADMQMINASLIQPDDVVIAISHSGKTRHVNEAVRMAHDSKAFTIGITQSVKSPMTQYCDLLFFNAVSDITVGKTIVAHRLAESTIIEILYAGVINLIPDQANAFLKKSADILTINKTY